MNELPAYLLFQLGVVLGFHRDSSLSVLTHILASVMGGLILERLHTLWGAFAMSYVVLLMTCLWALDGLLVLWQSLRDRRLCPVDLCRECSKWLLWMSILFVAYILTVFDPLLSVVSRTLEMAVILTQAVYVLKGAAQLLDNPLAHRLVKAFEGRLERRLQEVLDELADTRRAVAQVHQGGERE